MSCYIYVEIYIVLVVLVVYLFDVFVQNDEIKMFNRYPYINTRYSSWNCGDYENVFELHNAVYSEFQARVSLVNKMCAYLSILEYIECVVYV